VLLGSLGLPCPGTQLAAVCNTLHIQMVYETQHWLSLASPHLLQVPALQEPQAGGCVEPDNLSSAPCYECQVWAC
jgi:hypothetical protein